MGQYGHSGGFTLIELVVVVLIISILGVIAVPRYQELMARAQNGGALADLGQFCVTEAAFLGDFSQYGRTNGEVAVAPHGNGVILMGSITTNPVIACPTQFHLIGLSAGVHLVAHTSAPDGAHFSVMAKHIGGTRVFGADNVSSGLYQRQGQRQQALVDAGISLAATAVDDFVANGWEDL